MSRKGFTKSQAIIFESKGHAICRDIEVEEPARGEIQVETEFSVISVGTERWLLNNAFTWDKSKFPCVPGYQRSGKVTRVGAGVAEFRIGQRVAVTISDGFKSLSSQWGGHVSLGNAPVKESFLLPEGISAENAAGFVVAQVGYNAASRLIGSHGDAVVVYGDGLIGQFAAQAARDRGFSVVLVGRSPERLALAAAGNTCAIVSEREGSVVQNVRVALSCEKVMGVIDTVQTLEAEESYLDLLSHGEGQIVYSGFTAGKVWADMARLQQRELTTHFISGWTRARLEKTLELMTAKRLCLEPLITHRFAPTEAVKAYRLVQEKSDPFLGILFDWRAK